MMIWWQGRRYTITAGPYEQYGGTWYDAANNTGIVTITSDAYDRAQKAARQRNDDSFRETIDQIKTKWTEEEV